MSKDDLVAKIRDYCETMGSTDALDVEHACNRLGKANSAFIPSAGQVYSAAQENAARRRSNLIDAMPRLPRYEQPPEVREKMKAAFAELLAELQSGKNFNPEYGLLRPGEKPRDPYHFTRNRVTPKSWLEKWEAENGRPYYSQDCWDDAAE